MTFLLIPVVVISAYFYGCFSTARVVAKSFRSLDIYKVGNGMADTENIYCHVSKPMGVLVGAMDILKALLFLLIVENLFRSLDYFNLLSGSDLLYHANIMLLYGMAMLFGHCLPITHRFRGGRGIFTYTGFLLYVVPVPMLITLIVAWLIVHFFRQIRFAQYVIVILPVLLTHVLAGFFPRFLRELPHYFIAIIWGIAIMMGVLNYIVSKKMGEI